MKNYTSILLLAGIIILVNVLSNQFSFRLDLTADKQYTLGQATKDILKDLEEPITVTAYFTEDLPAQYSKIKKDFKELLIEYSNRSGGMVDYEFINPNASKEKEQEAQQKGIVPLQINMRENDEFSQKRAYLGAVIQMGEAQDVLPYVEPGGAMEYALTTSIKKISVTDKPPVGLVQGHGEASLAEMPQAAKTLSILYKVESLPLAGIQAIPDKYKTIAIVAPKDSFPQQDFKLLDDFLARGGNIYVAINTVDADFTQAAGNAKSTGLEGWLGQKGVQIDNSFVVDANCGAISVRRGNFPFPQQVKFPFLPIITKFEDHPISRGLEQVSLQFASPINFMGGAPGTDFIPIAYSSNRSGTVSTPTIFDIEKQWTGNDLPLSNLAVAGVLEGTLVGNTPSKIVVVSDGDFAINGQGQQQQQLSQDNVSLMVNSIDWLSDDTGLIDLRTRAVASRPIEQLEDGKRTMLKYLNFLLPIFLVLGYGIFQNNRRKRQRTNRRLQEWTAK